MPSCRSCPHRAARPGRCASCPPSSCARVSRGGCCVRPARLKASAAGRRISGSSSLLDRYDEPEILLCPTALICLIGPDAGHPSDDCPCGGAPKVAVFRIWDRECGKDGTTRSNVLQRTDELRADSYSVAASSFK